MFAIRWWEAFRLVLLLAIGPALIGLAPAMVHRPKMVVPKVTTLPDGSKEEIRTLHPSYVTHVITTDKSGGQTMREATAEEIAARPVMPRRSAASLLSTGVLAVLTVLTHGAWFVSLGLALGIGIRSRRAAIATSVGLFLFVTVGWPLLYYLYLLDLYEPTLPAHYNFSPGLVLASSVPTLVVLLIDHPPRQGIIEPIVWWATLWNSLLILMASVVGTLAVGILDHRSRASPSSQRIIENEEPMTETVLVGD
jgi:hypothetical protein